jgi:NADH-quinone oxidoreductase chain G
MITLDNTKYAFNSTNTNMTIYQYCQTKNITLPCFCYHEKLTIAGNCRMCLVEVNGALAISCSMPLSDRMNIITSSQRLLHSRETVLEFLLVNHPLDCPICDQGGECDLQDITLIFGMDRGRFYSEKRSVDNLNCFGPLVKTIMTRCIHCTRCVRFLNEYTDTFDLGTIGRGNSMEIGTYIETVINDELSANIIDLCPVGALTSMPYTFTARPWELKSIESIDIFDSLASSIRIDVANNTIVRVLPILMETINEDWITNKARFAFDALSVQRFYYPKMRVNDKWITCSWNKALELYLTALNNPDYKKIAAVCGKYTDLETAYSIKQFFNSIGSQEISYETNAVICNDFRFTYLLNCTIAGLESCSLVILINSNLRLENPLLNSRIRKNYLKSKVPVYSFGNAVTYTTFPIINLGNSPKTLLKFMQGKHYHFKDMMFNNTKFSSLAFVNCFIPYRARPVFLIGSTVVHRIDGMQLISSVKYNYDKNLKIYNMIPSHLGFISCNEFGFRGNNKFNIKEKNFIHYLGTDKIKANNGFSVYQGYQLPDNDKHLDLYLPTTNNFEQISTYMNIEGRLRQTKVAISSPKSVLTNAEILKLINLLRNKYYKHNFSVIPEFNKTMTSLNGPIIYNKQQSIKTIIGQPTVEHKIDLVSKIEKIKLANAIFTKAYTDFYSDDLISRHSKIMSLCSAQIKFSSFSKKLNDKNKPN